MDWWWKVRIYNKAGLYWHGQICTGRDLKEIDGIQDFYFTLTGCKMLLEGMNDQEYENTALIQEAFLGLWQRPAVVGRTPIMVEQTAVSSTDGGTP